MKYILCYGDSNTWGRVPNQPMRYDFCDRWPGKMELLLGAGYRVYENALNGRTTVFEDPIEEGRNGRANFEVSLMCAAPMDLIIFMLGTNDTKERFCKEPWDIAWGLDLLVSIAQKSGGGPLGKPPAILIASPIHLNGEWGSSMHNTIFSSRSIQKSKELAKVYKEIAKKNHCDFINAALFAEAEIDGVHMTARGHASLAEAMAAEVKQLIG